MDVLGLNPALLVRAVPVGVAAYKAHKAAKAARAAKRTADAEKKARKGYERDETGKIHGDLPEKPPKDWTKEEMQDTADELKKSIERRKQEQLDLGEDGPHRDRIRQQEEFLRKIMKCLSGS